MASIFTTTAVVVAACSGGLWAGQAGAGKDNFGCPVFPSDNVWNVPVDKLPVDPSSNAYVQSIGAAVRLHPDFGAGLYQGAPIGIPYIVVNGKEPKIPVRFDYAGESDESNYPIPPNAPVEGNGTGDSHVLVIDNESCTLYELFAASYRADGSWKAGSGAIFDLRSNVLRPAGWTSADAAGLPIFPGLVRYAEVASGQIRHALRFTAPRTRNEYIWPARHQASRLMDRQYPPMGQRFRLKASVDIARFSPDAQVVMRSLKTYGMFLADNGGPWFLSGAPDEHWSYGLIDDLKSLHGSDFEAVDESALQKDNNSAGIRSTPPINAIPLRQPAMRIPPSSTDLKTPGVLSIELELPQGSAAAAIQWEFSVPAVIGITTTDITISNEARSAGKSLTCAKRPTVQRRSRYACMLAGGQEPIPSGLIAEIQYRAQWDMKGAPVQVSFKNILGVSSDLRRISIPDVNADITIK